MQNMQNENRESKGIDRSKIKNREVGDMDRGKVKILDLPVPNVSREVNGK